VHFHCKLKNYLSYKISSHAVATLNSNMHITFQVNQIISMRVLYNGNFKNCFEKNVFKVL